MFSNTLSFLSSRNVNGQVSHPYKTTGNLQILRWTNSMKVRPAKRVARITHTKKSFVRTRCNGWSVAAKGLTENLVRNGFKSVPVRFICCVLWVYLWILAFCKWCDFFFEYLSNCTVLYRHRYVLAAVRCAVSRIVQPQATALGNGK